ncbi:MAG: YfiR family protein [Phycisphaeraceae bacterium]|nr:YfiR family protein [Phycisphaeraceae bacterium]
MAIAFVACLLYSSSAAPGASQEELAARRARLRAVFLLNFARYTTFPEEAFEEDDSPLIITVVGEARLWPYLRALALKEKVNERAIVVQSLPYPEAAAEDADEEALEKARQEREAFIGALRRSHVVYVPTADAHHAPLVLESVRGADVLTVGGAGDFVEAGGMLEMRRRYERMTFAANLIAIRATRLRVSSKLLQLAEWVKEED